ncbi:MAG TPA: type I-E CRISPR-associated protein Cas6/Cse3/CasE [Longimicrobiaceae bacterium]|nr:type I-E CRISPR-associated protein Cas6/Cse3/CasE [Longimicrobiaceae bacterium]
MSTDGLVLSCARLQIRRGGGESERQSTAPYFVHQAVADLFGDRGDRGYLYRVTAEWPGGRDVLILSDARPLDVSGVSSPNHRRATRIESRVYDPHVSAGQLLDYEVRVNATQVRRGPDLDRKGKPRQHRHDVWELVWQADKQTPCTPHDVYGEWMKRQLSDVAELLDTRVTERGEVQARRGDRASGARFVATNLIGTLRVTDPERFLEIVAQGIGREKAFGCGLLCLSRPGTVLARRYPERAAELL